MIMSYDHKWTLRREGRLIECFITCPLIWVLGKKDIQANRNPVTKYIYINVEIHDASSRIMHMISWSAAAAMTETATVNMLIISSSHDQTVTLVVNDMPQIT